MDQYPGGQGGWTILIPILVLGLVFLRNSRTRTLKMERLWIGPAIIALMVGLALYAQPPSTGTAIVLDAIALVVGAVLGWWRGRASVFTVDPETHVVTSKVSPAGMILILAIFGLRYAIRFFAKDEATALHVSPVDIADSFLVLAAGMVFVQRVEWFVRARRMIDEAKAAKLQAS